jgi:copper chaperone
MNKKIMLVVDGISCNHCVKSIEDALMKIDGIYDIEVSLEYKTVDIEFDETKTNLDEIKEAIEDQGYDVK